MLKYLVPSLVMTTMLPLAAQDAEAADAADDSITISSTRLDSDPIEQPYAFYRHDRLRIDEAIGRTALDRINYGPGVFVQSTAPNQFSPFIRGLTGEQTLLKVDGIRLSHATMRPGPNQYAALIPDMSISSIDVILGPSAAATGSDGLTGLLDFRLAETGRGVDKQASAWGKAKVDHANGTQVSAGVDGVTENWAYSVEGGFAHYHDRIGGRNASSHLSGFASNDNRIPNTAYDQFQGAARIAYTGLDQHRFELKLGHTYQDEAPRPDGYPENSGKSDRISRYFDPHAFTYAHLGHTWTPETHGWIDSLRSTLWFHVNDETQIRERVRGPGYRREDKEDTTTGIGLDTELKHQIGNHSLQYGLELSFESTDNSYARYEGVDASSTARVGTALQDRQRSTIPDGSTYDTIAAYAQDQWLFAEDWELLIGARFTFVRWESDVEGRSGFTGIDSIDDSTNDLSGGLRLGWHFRPDMMAFAGFGRAFRAPNLTNLTGITDRGSSGIEVAGNGGLDPEVSYTVEGGWKYQEADNIFQATVFVTTIEDLIQPVYTDDNSDGIIDTNDSGRMTNSEGADLMGFELFWDHSLPVTDWIPHTQRVALVGSTSYVDAEVDLTQADGSVKTDNLSRANRFYGLFGVEGRFTDGWWLRPQLRWHSRYDKTADSDSGDVRLTMAGTADGEVPGYAIFDLAAGWRNDTGTREVTVTVENVGNKTYREPGSAVDGAGFNLGLAGGVRF